MQKCITWTKKSQKGARALREAQIHCRIKEKRLLTPGLTWFAYLIHSFRYLLENKPAIEYLYRTMPGIHDNIWERRPSLVDWEVIHMIVTRMKRIVDSIVINQCSGKEWLLSEEIVDLVWIYNYCSGDEADNDVTKHLHAMVEERGNSPDADNLRSNLLEVHSNMRSQVKDKLTNVLTLLLQIPAPTKYHYWFDLFLYPRYAMELTDIKAFHQSKNIDT